MACYDRLDPFPENRGVLEALRAGGVRAGVLSNGDPDMLAAVVGHAGFADLLDPVLSVEGTGRFKTDPATYALGTDALQLPAAEVLFVSSNCWDAIGATWFGYTTLWVNRFGLPLDELGAAPTRTGTSLAEVLSFFPSTSASGIHPMTLTLPPGVAINAPILPGFETILTEPALALVAQLHRAFEPRRQELLAARAERAAADRRRRAARLPRRDEGDPRRRLEDRARARRRWSAAASRSPARSTPRWSSTRSTRARTST